MSTPARPARPRAAVFDVDGTLVDTNYLHAVSWWEAFHQAGHRVTMTDIHHTVGMGSGRLIDRLLGEDRDRSGDEAVSAAHKAVYATYFDRLPALEGAAELLRALADRGWRVVLATSAQGVELEALRRAIGADDAIHAATSADDVDASKPAPDAVVQALEQAEAPPERALFVGDTVWDVQAARAAGVDCVALLSGGIGRAELESAGAVAVYRDPAALLADLDASPFARVE
ncbi:HAD family hydrolase [Streptomyces cinnamoneus]|uniref:HAD family hydrolase n=1 Tax=Streptomyces cinnamoneus TaxID=53446 RepID=A0A2G1XKT3_STRCJ|nr:HAD family hydrolase [Streptomyces cinnamoneus]PHQ51845.1 HAD family hydrolase [Streptomyces cinnamoneus]PPT16308.1 HAD family hydrolase [Streptomyces cinnamoneus]